MMGGTRTLKAGELLTLVGELYRNRETGTLVLQGGNTTKYLYFQEGEIIFAASNAPEDKFTNILVEGGQLTQQQLEMATEKKGDRTIGKTLVELGFLSSADLLHALVMQVHRVALSSLLWESGDATFKPNVLPGGVAKLPISTPRFILDLSQQVENRAWVGQVLGGMETVLKIASAEREAAVTMGLQDDEQRLVDLIDGKRSVRELCEGAQVDLFKGAKFCLGLTTTGLGHVSGLLHKPQEQSPAKPLDLSFLDSMIPSPQEQASPMSTESPFQAPEPEALPEAAPLPVEAPSEPPPLFFAPPAPPPEEAAIPMEPSAPATVAEPAPFTPSLDPFAGPSIPTGGEPEAPPPPPPDPAPVKPALPKFEKVGAKSSIKGPANPQLFENLASSPVEETASKRPPVTRVEAKKPAGGRNGKLLGTVAAALVVLGGIGGGAYWWFFLRADATPPPAPQPTPKPVAAKPIEPANPQAPQPAPTTATPEAASPGGTPTQGAPTVPPAATEIPPPTPKPEPVNVEPPKASPAPVVPPKPTPKPEPPTAAVPVSGAMTLSTPEVRQTLVEGNYGEAAGAFAYQARNTSAAFTINIEVACQHDTISKGLSAAGGSEAFFILPYDLKGRACFAVYWGLYPDRPSAEKALSTLPGFFRESAQPKVVPWSTVKK